MVVANSQSELRYRTFKRYTCQLMHAFAGKNRTEQNATNIIPVAFARDLLNSRNPSSAILLLQTRKSRYLLLKFPLRYSSDITQPEILSQLKFGPRSDLEIKVSQPHFSTRLTQETHRPHSWAFPQFVYCRIVQFLSSFVRHQQ